jgi:hypothetical protein
MGAACFCVAARICACRRGYLIIAGNCAVACTHCAVNRTLTITARLLLKRNYNTMNQAFIAIVVKILAPKFTIPTRFVD